MEIIRFKKGKKNIYEVELSNGSIIKLYDDIIIKYNLLINKSLTNSSLNKIVEENDSLDAYYESIKKINTKLRSEKELINYLKKKEYSTSVIDKTIDKLKKDGYLNEDLYLKSYIHDAFNLSSDGPDKIRFKLIQLGFKEETINKHLNLDFSVKAHKLIDKKLKYNKLNSYLFKQKITTQLINLGYPKELFMDYLNSIEIDNKDLLISDARKLLKKYQNKYAGEKLIFFVKDKLYKKGYKVEEIEALNEELL